VPPVAPSNRPWPPKPTPVSSSTKIDDVTTINFFPEDHGVRHPSAVVLVPTTSTSTTITTSSSLEAILQSSIEDAIVPVLTSSQPVSLTTSVIASPTTQLSVSSVPPSTTTPQLEAGPSSPITTSVFDGINQAFTPPLPAARPGQVFHDVVSPEQGEVDVITSDNIQPQGAYPDSFELVVTAAQNFGSGPALAGGGGQPVTGRPLVIPVSIDQLRQPTAAVASDTDDYVSIDGRKTYFNLYPTDVVGAADSVQVQPTVMPDRLPAPVQQQQQQQQQGFAYPTPNFDGLRPAVIPQQRPNYPTKAAAVPMPNRPTPTLIRRPSSTTPPARIDACIVGDPNACLEPNESCQAEVDGSACSCKPGFGRKKASDVCKALSGFLVSVRLDRLDNQRLSWSQDLTDPSSAEYQQLEWEANQAINSMMEMIPLTSHYVTSSVNKFYAIGNKVIVNASVFMDQSPETQSVTVRPTLTKQLLNLIGQRNNNLGISRLFVDTTANPITAILDLNECGAPELNDCSPDAECINTAGSFTCECKAGFSDPFVNDPNQVGRQCNSCTRSYCNNRGDCSIDKGKKICQ